MNQTLLTSVMLTGFGIAFFHAALPTHWLPFVLAGRGQNWSRGKTLAVTTTAGIGHVLFTILLGVVVVWVGQETSQWTGQVFPYIAGGVLVLVGIYYLLRHAWGRGHGHHHGDHDHHHDHPHDHHHEHVARAARSDWAIIGGLLAMLTFSPCEGFLPVYLSGIRYGWRGFVILSALLAVATVAGMVILTWLTLAGLERLKLDVLERYESAILGSLLCALGLFVMVLER
jgi:nickel/cobalt transporter (NicO) family protein